MGTTEYYNAPSDSDIAALDSGVRIVDMTAGGNSLPKGFTGRLEKAFGNLELGFELEISSSSIVPDDEDLKWMNALLVEDGLDERTAKFFHEKYSDVGEMSLLLLDGDYLIDAAGRAFYGDSAFVEISQNPLRNLSISIHELGHLISGIRHNYLSKGVMSYNGDPKDISFNERSKLIAEANFCGEKDFKVDEIQGSDSYKVLIRYKPGKVSESKDREYFFQNLRAYIENMLEVDMEGWMNGEHKVEQKDDTLYDLATFQHLDGRELEMEINRYIESLKMKN